ncbi:hypothetical protein Vau01_111310 [Virgisporangium aurantiacum]|uniref:Uncharacterized protein n=1 Tax=Virgisporangium aurantiacum TaxID=175570 RepID=A0A8J3ZKI8_9ACTN|nr:hypothetical protein Vau01_111310 [Virgisporangium aurantiacum]
MLSFTTNSLAVLTAAHDMPRSPCNHGEPEVSAVPGLLDREAGVPPHRATKT